MRLRAPLSIAHSLALSLALSLGFSLVFWACGSETEDGASAAADSQSTSRDGAGGETATSAIGAGGSGGQGGGDGGVPACAGCAEVTTSSAPRPICPGASTEILQKLAACVCVACPAPCADPCAGGMNLTPECSACKIMAYNATCLAEYDACASDV
jgi:hypothetical protein